MDDDEPDEAGNRSIQPKCVINMNLINWKTSYYRRN